MGKGMALRHGFDMARTKNLKKIFTLDADGQHWVMEIDNFLKVANDYDLIIGTRSYKLTRMPFLRKLVNRTTSLVASLLSKKYIPDVQCGFRYIDLKIFKRIKLETKNFQTESELVIKVVKMGYRVGFVPITTIYRAERSYINPLIDTIRFITLTGRFLWH